MEERDYVVPMRRGFVKTPRYIRTKRAISVLRAFLVRHCKAEIRIGQHLNEEVWARGIRNPPGKVKVHCWIEEKDGKRIAKVELAGKPFSESVRPEEKEEKATGLKGKLQEATKVLKKQPKDETESAEPGKAEQAKSETKAGPAVETKKPAAKKAAPKAE